MRVSSISTLIGSLITLATSITASPIAKRQAAGGIDDVTILQFALTLEHLENAFYRDALAKFDAAAFEAAGFPDWVRGRIAQISGHEASHVALLSGALGSAAVQPCTYNFPYTDPKSFAMLSKVLEEVGVSAYLGAAPLIQNPAYLTVAGSILTTEARHQAWVSSAVLRGEPWSTAYDTPVGANLIFNAARAFITSCPAGNAALPFTNIPALTYANGKVAFDGLTGNGQYAVLYQGLSIATYPIAADGSVSIPAPQGISFITISTERNATLVGDANLIAGPAIQSLTFTSKVANPDPSFTSA